LGTDVTMRPATHEDAVALARVMRPEDAAEVQASHGHGPLDALLAGVEKSQEAWAVYFDDEPACMWGYTVEGAGVTVPWLLTGPAVARHRRTFLLMCCNAIAWLCESHTLLAAMVDARYGRALRWAAWLGFDVQAPIPYGRDGEPFCPVFMRGRTHG
jgi:hypothetical protein